MKSKFKFDTAVIKNFFSDHVEKIVVGICVIVMLYMISTIFKRETLPTNLQPTAIASKTRSADDAVKSSLFKDSPDLTPTEVPGAVAPVPVAPLAEIRPFVKAGGPLDDPVKRTDPTFFAAEAPQAKSFVLPMATNAAGGTAGSGLTPTAPPIGRQLDSSRPRDPSAPGGAAPATNGRNPRGGRQPHSAAPTTPPNGLLPGSKGATGADAAGNPDNMMPIPAAMPVPGASGTGSAEVRPFNIVTAAIPFERQMKEYVRRFMHARHADMEMDPRNPGRGAQQQMSDVPQYIWWRLERIDLTSGQEKTVIDYGDVMQVVNDRDPKNIGADLVMQTLKPTGKFQKLNKDVAQWGGVGAEVVPSEYLAESWMSWPLPPMLLRDWGREATNPKIPLVAPQPSETPDGTNPTEPGKAKPADSDNPFDDKALGSDAATSPAPRAATPAPAPFMNGRVRGGRGYDPSAPLGGGRRPHDSSAPRNMPNFAGNGQQFQQNPDAPQVPYKLFRFTDFDVEPGHTYQYRIQLVLRNPNFGQPPELLEKPQPKPLPYADAPWSEMSAPTTVPVLTKVVLEGIDRPRHGDPKARAGVLAWYKKDSDAVELLAKSELVLGDVANFVQKKILAVLDPVNRNVHDFTGDFISNAALVDLHGGDEKIVGDDKLAPDAGGQGELLVLVVGRNGAPDQLAVVNQALDKFALDAWEKTHKVPKELADAEADQGPGRPGRDTSAPGGLLGPRNPSGTRQTRPAPAPGVGR